MSALFEVSVLKKQETQLTLGIKIINPDQKSFYKSKGFATLLLTDPFHTNGITEAQLLKEIPLSEIENFNLEFIARKAKKIIKDVELTDINNFPVPDSVFLLDDTAYQQFWNDRSKLPSATLCITTTDPGFTDHLQPHDQWESGAFDIQ